MNPSSCVRRSSVSSCGATIEWGTDGGILGATSMRVNATIYTSERRLGDCWEGLRRCKTGRIMGPTGRLPVLLSPRMCRRSPRCAGAAAPSGKVDLDDLFEAAAPLPDAAELLLLARYVVHEDVLAELI